MNRKGKVLYCDGENSRTDLMIQLIQAALVTGVISPDDVLDEVALNARLSRIR